MERPFSMANPDIKPDLSNWIWVQSRIHPNSNDKTHLGRRDQKNTGNVEYEFSEDLPCYPLIGGGMPIEVKFVLTHEKARLPQRAHPDPFTGDTGSDVYSVEDAVVPAGKSVVVPIGLTLAYITPGFWFKIEARSGLGFKHGIQPHPGIVDNSYRGDCGIKLYNFTNEDYKISSGDRIAQFVYYPIIVPHYTQVKHVQETQRGSGGFGHTGK